MKSMIAIAIAAAALCGSAVAADADNGKAVYNAKGCIGCHGVDGNSVIPANPVLRGRDSQYITDALIGFKRGTRQNATMNAMAGLLSDDEIKDVAAYLSAQ